MQIRHADPSDQNDINRIYACARALMKADGNPNQWGDKKPYPDVLRFAIENNRLYIVENEGRAVGGFAFYEGPDPTYNYIENGSWSNDGPYHVIHRVASDGSVKGVMNTILAFCFQKLPICAWTPTTTTTEYSTYCSPTASEGAAQSTLRTETKESVLTALFCRPGR